MASETYNYAVFPPDDDVDAFGGFQGHLPVGDRAADPELTDLATGATVRLSDYISAGLLVVEFGSLT